jgi:hypothetical protein
MAAQQPLGRQQGTQSHKLIIYIVRLCDHSLRHIIPNLE